MTVETTDKFKRAARTSTVLFFLFMLLHQTDKLLIGPLQPQVMETFNMTYTQWGLINTGALLVGAILYPVWGWLNDRYNRGKLLALASFIWGSTTWLSSIVKTFPGFLAARSSTGIDESSYPGMMSLLADYYPPSKRGRIFGTMQLTGPIGYLLGMVLALVLGGMIGWRSIFVITGMLGILLAIAIFFGVKDVPRGSSEAELKGVETSKYKFNWQTALSIFKKRSLIFVFAQGFIGVFPWNTITYYIFGYLATDRGYDSNTQLMIMAPAVLFMALGNPAAGMLGDYLFSKTRRGRLIAAAIGIFLGAVLLYFTMSTGNDQVLLFAVLLMGTAFFMPFGGPNVLSTIFDVTLPEVRSTANAIQNFIELIVSATSPLIAGIIADHFTVGTAILSISLIAWGLCFVFILIAIVLIPADIKAMHGQLQERAMAEDVLKKPD